MTLFFETHATSLDNETGIASGQFDVDLSALGKQQARELGERYRGIELASVCCSDLRRSYRTAEIAFAGRDVPIQRDARLRECAYGDLTRQPSKIVEALRLPHANIPFPNGESYRQVTERVRSFLEELPESADVLLIGHRATFYALEHLLGGVPLSMVITTPWTWQPGWTYSCDMLKT